MLAYGKICVHFRNKECAGLATSASQAKQGMSRKKEITGERDHQPVGFASRLVHIQYICGASEPSETDHGGQGNDWDKRCATLP